MTRILSVMLLLALSDNAGAQQSKVLIGNTTTAVLPTTVVCVTMPALKLCPGDPPTVWMDPKAEPRDVAQKLLEALQMMGYRVQ